MKTLKPNCPHCNSSETRVKDKRTNRFKCKGCKKTFTHKEDFEAKTETVTNQYNSDEIVLSAWNPETGKVLSIDEYCEYHNLPRKDVRSYKLVSHTGTPYYNIAFHEHVEELDFLTEEFLNSIISKHCKIYKGSNIKPKVKTSNVVRGIYTDVHVGMHPDKKGISIYGGQWNKEEQYDRIISFAEDLISTGIKNDSYKLIVDDLGDFVDGWDGMTVRRGHNLPQNLTNEEMFDRAVSLKVHLCDVVVNEEVFTEVIFNNICNDNHSGSFGYVVNSAVKSILEAKYSNVKVINHRKFINHYTVGKHTFIISHGKDMEDSKFGFKPKLDQPGEKKIQNYIISNGIIGHIEFSKGDSHQCLFDYCTSDIFDYLNHCSFAPPSQWVQTNFQKGRSGYSIQTFDEFTDELPMTLPKFFK